MTKYMSAEGLEATIRATAGEKQLARYEELKSEGWVRADIRQSPCRRYIAIGMTRASTSGYQGGYLCSDGKFALPPRGKTGVRLNADCTRAF